MVLTMQIDRIRMELPILYFKGSKVEKNLIRPRTTVGNMSDCRSRGREVDPSPILYFCGD